MMTNKKTIQVFAVGTACQERNSQKNMLLIKTSYLLEVNVNVKCQPYNKTLYLLWLNLSILSQVKEIKREIIIYFCILSPVLSHLSSRKA